MAIKSLADCNDDKVAEGLADAEAGRFAAPSEITDLRRRFASVDPNTHHAVLRERIVEHLFIGQLLRAMWIRGITDGEILKSEFDAGGYDLVLSRGPIVRHIQLKTILDGGKNRSVSVNLKLAQKPSGCVVWIVLSNDLTFVGFRWLGGPPGSPLMDVQNHRVTKHTKGNSEGKKLERPMHRKVKWSEFDPVASIEGILQKLIGNAS